MSDVTQILSQIESGDPSLADFLAARLAFFWTAISKTLHAALRTFGEQYRWDKERPR